MPLETPDGKCQLESALDGGPVQGALGDVRKEGVKPDGSVVVIALLEGGTRARMRMVDVPMHDREITAIGARSVDVLGGLRRKRRNRRRGR